VEKQNWEGLWLQNTSKEMWKSKVFDLKELVDELGTSEFRILMVRNTYYNGNNKMPQYRFVLIRPEQETIPNESYTKPKRQKYYAKELVDNDDLSWY